ncbi:MAG: hypothetical protein KF851_07330 [Pirellulaceae bacterium]|nr:hypothetical protein [Pirellulaceae bacterium]
MYAFGLRAPWAVGSVTDPLPAALCLVTNRHWLKQVNVPDPNSGSGQTRHRLRLFVRAIDQAARSVGTDHLPISTAPLGPVNDAALFLHLLRQENRAVYQYQYGGREPGSMPGSSYTNYEYDGVVTASNGSSESA